VPVLRIEFTGDEVPASVSGEAVHELSTSLGIDSSRAQNLRAVIDELVNIARRREHGDRPAQVEVRAWTEKGYLHVEVKDQGIPERDTDPSVLHELVRLGLAEFIQFENHGRDGNTALCRLALGEHEALSHLSTKEKPLAPDVPQADEFEQLEQRVMRPEECEGLARLVYRCYGYDYPVADVYYPERMAPLLEAGLMHSVVVVNPEGELVGHASLTKNTARSRVAEAGKLVVDPRYRAHGLAEQMADQRRAKAAELGLRGLWSECVTNHPYSQRNQLKLGARETGVFLGIRPDSVRMVGLGGEPSQRGSLMSMYLPLERGADHGFHPPPRYQETLRQILSNLELQREPVEVGETTDTPSRLTLSVDQANGVAVITADTLGQDFREQLEQRMENLLDMRIAAIYLDLPLGQPATAVHGNQLAGFGFFFSGLLPESAPDGDVLRLQFLNHEHPAPAELKLASEWGEQLLSQCVADQERVMTHIRQRRLSDRE
jgi:GNAT superfamily N-acetyltransferase